MAMGHAFFPFFFFPAIGIPCSARYLACSLCRSWLKPASIGLQSLEATTTKSLKSINKIHPTAKPN